MGWSAPGAGGRGAACLASVPHPALCLGFPFLPPACLQQVSPFPGLNEGLIHNERGQQQGWVSQGSFVCWERDQEPWVHPTLHPLRAGSRPNCTPRISKAFIIFLIGEK